jgi:phenylacetate-CoA ligase
MGLQPRDFNSVEDLDKLPVLTKELVRERRASLMARRRARRDWLLGHSSGTTGSPLSVWYDRRTCIMTNAIDRRQKMWAGMTGRDWIAYLLGRVVVPVRQKGPPFWRTNWIHRQLWFSTFHMAPETLSSYAAELKRREVRFLEGYPSTLYVLAKHLVENRSSLPMRAVITSSETLHDIQRTCIEEAFQCELFDFYALAERAAFAGECERHCGKHIAEDYSYVEIVNEDGRRLSDGQMGYIAGTNFHNRAMPLIRYRTDDVASIVEEQCTCGRRFRRLGEVATKAEDIVVTPDGRWISPSVLTHPFKTVAGVEKSQLVQEEEDLLVLKIVAADSFNAKPLLQALRERLGPEMHFRVELVSEIPRESSGKFRWVVSKLQHSHLVEWN